MGEIVNLADRRQARESPPSREAGQKMLIRALLLDIACNLGVDIGLPPMPAGRGPRDA